MATAKTVLGEVPASRLGRTLCHEHLLLTWPGAKYDRPHEYNVEALVGQVVENASKAIKDHNIKTLIDVSPWQLGRDVELQQLAARQLGINVVCATGFYRQEAGMADYWLYQELDAFEEFMLRELTEGVGPQKVKCGVIKIAWGMGMSFSTGGDPLPGEEKATRAAGRASKKTGAPIVCHCSWRANPSRNLGLEQVKMLVEEGADPERIQISHCAGVNGNLAYLLDVVKTGAYVALPDSPGLDSYSEPQAERITGLIGGLIRAGYGNKVVFGMDTIGAWFPKTPTNNVKTWVPAGHWNMAYDTYLPRLRAGGVSEGELERIMVENPARLFAW
ncbi:MAG: hypothetical protein HYY31_03220 [Chloroflexi bacterium]|nr:hypothetical protein [Chloroflexota bacterium]